MKKVFSATIATLALATLAVTAQAAVTSGTGNTALTIEPTVVSVAKSYNTSFGNITVGTSGGTIKVHNFSSALATGDVLMTGGSRHSGGFSVAGSPNTVYSVSIDAVSTMADAAGNTIALTHSLDNPTVTTAASGSVSFYPSSEATIPAGSVAGDYTGTYTVTVNY